jgi:trigger factor
MLPEFEAALSGMSAGESKTFTLRFPDDYHGKEVAGKTAHFALTAKDLTEPVLPELDDAFAHAFGVRSGKLEDLRAEVEANLKRELKRKVESVLKDQAFGGLRSLASFPLPKALIDIEAHGMMERMARELGQQGMKPEDMKLTPDMFLAQAEHRVALGLTVAELVRVHGLAAKPDQVKALVVENAQTYEQPEAVVRWHYEKAERLNEFEALAVERNVVDWVLSRARVVDKPTTFEALMGPARG